MITFKKVNLNRPYYFFSDAINIESVDPNLLSIKKISYKNSDVVVYSIKYTMMESINNTLCFSFSDVDAYIIEESGSKYLIFALTKKSKKVLKIYKKLWNEIKNQIKTINSGESVKYKKNPMTFKLNTNDDDIPLDKIFSFTVLSIAVKSVF